MKLEAYLQDTQGNPSSSRLMAYMLMWFFMIFNGILWPLFGYLTFLKPESNLDINWVIALLAFDFILALMIFTPKTLSKVQEIKEIIELAKSK